jgi:hypothetical protein
VGKPDKEHIRMGAEDMITSMVTGLKEYAQTMKNGDKYSEKDFLTLAWKEVGNIVRSNEKIQQQYETFLNTNFEGKTTK